MRADVGRRGEGRAEIRDLPPRFCPLLSASARALAAILVASCAAGSALGQQSQAGLGWSGLPAVNYDSDEGFGYGLTGGLYQAATRAPRRGSPSRPAYWASAGVARRRSPRSPTSGPRSRISRESAAPSRYGACCA